MGIHLNAVRVIQFSLDGISGPFEEQTSYVLFLGMFIKNENHKRITVLLGGKCLFDGKFQKLTHVWAHCCCLLFGCLRGKLDLYLVHVSVNVSL